MADSENRPQRRFDAADDADALFDGAVDPSGEVLGASGLRDPKVGELAADEDEAEELVGEIVDTKSPDVAEPQDAVVDDVEQLTEAELAAAKAKSSRPVKKQKHAAAVTNDEVAAKDEPTRPARNHSVAPVKKSPTKQPTKSEPVERGPIAFIKQSIGELKKVVWPSGSQTGQYFVVVLTFVLFIMLVVWGLDTLFGWIMLKLFS